MRIDAKQAMAFMAAIGTTGVEVYCVYDGLKAKGGAALVAGVGIAIVGPLVGAFMQGKRRWWGMAAFVLVLACIIVASGSRVGGAIDRAEGQREQASTASKVAKDTEHALHELLADARATKKRLCPDGKEKTKVCKEATARVDTLLNQWTASGTTLATAPVAGEGDIARISAWTGGWLSERQVSLYLPLLWPVTMAVLSGLFWAAWGDSRPAKLPPPTTPAIPEPMPAPAAAAIPAPELAALDVLIDIVQPADRRKRVEIENIHRAYVEACKARGIDVAPDEIFEEQAKAFAKVGNIRMLASDGKVYWCGVKLVA
jgi:hypothetical protein